VNGRLRTASGLCTAVAVITVVAGCGGTTRRHLSAAPATIPPTNTSPFNLQAADLPAGWTVVTPSTGLSRGIDPTTAGLFSCLHLPAGATDAVSELPSDTFGSGATLRAASDVTAVSPASVLTREISALQAPGGLACLGHAIGESVATQGAGVSNARIQALPVPGSGPDPVLGVHYAATFTEAGQSIDATADEFLIGHGSDEITVTFTALEAIFPASVEHDAVARLRARV
jgi:hypothetical protein